jgi:hypothetical protein
MDSRVRPGPAEVSAHGAQATTQVVCMPGALTALSPRLGAERWRGYRQHGGGRSFMRFAQRASRRPIGQGEEGRGSPEMPDGGEVERARGGGFFGGWCLDEDGKGARRHCAGVGGGLEARVRKGEERGAWASWPAILKVMRTSILWLQSFPPLRYLALSHDHEHNN